MLIISVVVLLGLFLMSRVRVGVALEYAAQRFTLKARVGTLFVTVLPGREKKAAKQKKRASGAPKEKKQFARYLPYVPCLMRAVVRVLRQIRVDKLDLHVRVGGADPADTAERYCQLNAAVGSLWGPFRSLVNVKEADVHLDVDFESERSKAQGSLAVSWRISQLLSTVVVLAKDLIVAAGQNRAANQQESMVI